MFILHRVRAIATALAATAGIAFLSGCVAVPDGVSPVTGFDLDRYLGRWYEVARLDHSFERGLTNVTATYALNEDGSVRVVNRGFDSDRCEYQERIGRATFVGDPSVASLAVSFFGPFAGGYHVIELAPDYSYAVVSGPSKEFFWVLSRTPRIDQGLLDRILADASAAGYPVASEIILVSQTGGGC
jgi:apolipoprotein D and lipocalin family protein